MSARTGSCTHPDQLHQCGFGFRDVDKPGPDNATKIRHEVEKLKRHFEALIRSLLKSSQELWKGECD